MFSSIFSMETVEIENKLDQDENGGKEEKIRQLWQELIESEMRYVEDLNEVRGIELRRLESSINGPRFAGIIYTHNQIRQKNSSASTGNILKH